MDIMGALAAIKQTIDITKELRNIDEKIDSAVWKLKLSDVIDKLIETKDALIEEKELQRQLRAEIAKLQEILADRGRFTDENGQLFEVDESGQKFGIPFCNHCYVKEQKRYRLRHFEAKQGSFAHYRCENCKVLIKTGPSIPFPAMPKRGSWMR